MQEQGSTVTARLTVWEKDEEKPHYYTPGQLLGEDSSSKKEQHEHQCRYQHERPEVRGRDQFKVPGSDHVQGWHLLSRNPHQKCLSNGKTKQDLVVQNHQLHKQVRVLQVSYRLHPPLWL